MESGHTVFRNSALFKKSFYQKIESTSKTKKKLILIRITCRQSFYIDALF